jgi:hypothetical protein
LFVCHLFKKTIFVLTLTLIAFIILQNAEGSFSMTTQFLLEASLRDFQILDNMPTYIQELTV